VKRAVLAPLVLLAACTPPPPARWAEGGAPLDLPRARWVRGDLTVDLMADGRVLVNGEQELALDRAGRVATPEGESVAVLEKDGRLVGNDDQPLGHVGLVHATLPDRAQAWLSVTDSGEVVRYGADGERQGFGAWMGCDVTPRSRQACTLVSHLVGLRLVAREREAGVSVGVGFGVRVR
jgi:hypothetical protein